MIVDTKEHDKKNRQVQNVVFISADVTVFFLDIFTNRFGITRNQIDI